MADSFVGHDFAAKTFPFQQPVGFPLTSFTGVPWGQAIVDETWESQAIGVGDTGTINLDVQIPNDYVSLLRSFHLQAYDTVSVTWDYGSVGLAYQSPGGPYKKNITELPESQYLWWQLVPGYAPGVRDRFSSNIYHKTFDIGTAQVSAAYRQLESDLNDPSKVPLWLPPGEATLQDRAMVVYLENNSASQGPATFRFNCVFDLYTQEQAYASGVMSSPRVFS
tara:strand:+ start:47 stop:712 length:666 start_codon:yes stop_codon:yes gene_type:complete